MTTDRDVTRIVRSWLEVGVTALPDRVLDTVLDQLPATPQRRAWRPAWRFRDMNSFAKLAVAAAAVVVVAVVGIFIVPRAGGVAGPGPSATPAPTASPVPLRDGALTPGTYVLVHESIRLMIDVPGGWSGFLGAIWIDENAAPGGAALGIGSAADLYREPCLGAGATRQGPPEIDVGTTVDGFANAIAAHPVLDATDPVDVSLGGFSGKYIDLRLPADLSSCEEFRPWDPGIYAQGPSHQWHLWILDVAGTRVVVAAMDYPGTSPQRRAELQAMVESIQIEP